MFRHKTVLILGAGASCEADLPAGDRLRELIVNSLQSTDVAGSFRDARTEYAVKSKAQQLGGVNRWPEFLPSYRNAARIIIEGLPLAPSIDHFLDTHAGNKEVELLGKLAIASTILEAERSSRLAPQRTTGVALDPNAIQGTWYTAFMRMVTQAVHRDKINEVFRNLTMISFNYDRCIEHFLFIALQAYFAIDQKAATKALSGLKVIHPYGLVGTLPWQRGDMSVPFGGSNDDNLLDVAESIQTFTETVESGTASEICVAIAEAESIAFLGFGYHRQNMKLLRPRYSTHARRVFATMGGISAWDKATALDLIRTVFRDAQPEIYDHARTCSALFDEYRLKLTQELLA